MNPRENALRTIRFDNPERVMTGPPCHVVCYHGCNHEGYEGGGHDCPAGTIWTDIWGTVWRKSHEGWMGFPIGPPLADPAALSTYAWPDPADERIVAPLLLRPQIGDEAFLTGSHRDTLWEKSYMLVGMENVMVAFRDEPGFVRDVLHRIMGFQLGIAEHYLRLGVEMVNLGDDLGTQKGPLLSPDIVEEFLVPEYERLFTLYREHGVLINFHSCGNIEWMLDTFMRLGVDVLNPVQATANDLDRVRAATQGRMALLGGVSTRTLMEGPVEAIVSETSQRIHQLGRDGGYFCCPDQGLPFPEEHVRAFHEAVERFGVYPIGDQS